MEFLYEPASRETVSYKTQFLKNFNVLGYRGLKIFKVALKVF